MKGGVIENSCILVLIASLEKASRNLLIAEDTYGRFLKPKEQIGEVRGVIIIIIGEKI